MRRLLCLLLGHRFGAPTTVIGFDVRRCERCGTSSI
jgi:hypothetical protein